MNPANGAPDEAEPMDSAGDAEKKKRVRRKFAELDRIYNCPFRDCGRPYASEHSLQQHIRLKVSKISIDWAKCPSLVRFSVSSQGGLAHVLNMFAPAVPFLSVMQITVSIHAIM